MPKMKTHKGASKRFKMTKSGRIKRAHAFKNHILGKKSTKRKRGLRQTTFLDKTNEDNVRAMLPYAK